MADGVAITAGSGTTILTDDTGAGGHAQVVKLAISTDGSGTLIPADATNGIDVDVTRLPASTNTLEVVGDVAQDAAIAGNPLSVGGRASTATPTAMSADGDSVFFWLDRSGAQVVTGYAAEDAVLAGNPTRIGVRASTAVPNAMSADGDVVTPWATREGAQVIVPQPRTVDIQGVSNLQTTPDYSAGDYMGSVITFTSVALASGRPLQIVGATLLDRAIQSIALTLLLFRASPTVASADNAALSITAANASSARFLGAIKFQAADYVGATSCSFCPGELQKGPIPIVTSGSANIFGVLVAGGTYNAAAAGDLEINLVCNQF